MASRRLPFFGKYSSYDGVFELAASCRFTGRRRLILPRGAATGDVGFLSDDGLSSNVSDDGLASNDGLLSGVCSVSDTGCPSNNGLEIFDPNFFPDDRCLPSDGALSGDGLLLIADFPSGADFLSADSFLL